MGIFGFGTFAPDLGYKILDERAVRGSSGFMFLVGLVAFVYGFIIKEYAVLPYLSGFLAINFGLAIFVGHNAMPTYLLARLMVFRQTILPIGAVQKRFAWSLGFALSCTIFGLSLLLVEDASWFNRVCELCLLCLLLLFLETAFGICVGCQIYKLTVKVGLLKEPEVRPNCMGDACQVDD